MSKFKSGGRYTFERGDRVEWCGSLDTRRWAGTIQKIFSGTGTIEQLHTQYATALVRWDGSNPPVSEHDLKDLQHLNVLDKLVEALEA